MRPCSKGGLFWGLFCFPRKWRAQTGSCVLHHESESEVNKSGRDRNKSGRVANKPGRLRSATAVIFACQFNISVALSIWIYIHIALKVSCKGIWFFTGMLKYFQAMNFTEQESLCLLCVSGGRILVCLFSLENEQNWYSCNTWKYQPHLYSK